MKKIKLMFLVAFLSVASYAGYSAYDYVTMSDAERFLLQNIEALTGNEPGGGGRGDREDYFNDTDSYSKYTASADAKIKEQGFTVTWSKDVLVILNYCKWNKGRHCYSEDTGVKYEKK